MSRAADRPGEVILHRRRIYILPTRQGWGFALALAVMLLGSINYNNGLGYVLTFLLASVALVSMLHTHRNLSGLRLTTGDTVPGFAGGEAGLRLRLDNREGPDRESLVVRYPPRGGRRVDDRVVAAGIGAGDERLIELAVPAPRRGRLALPRLTIATRYPLGLFRAWSYFEADRSTLVYPRPEGRFELPRGGGETRPHGAVEGSGAEDFSGFRDYVPGDSPRHIHWRAVAREQGVPLKLFEGSGAAELLLDYRDATGEPEARLSQLCRWVLEADARDLRYGLALPGETIPAGGGERHRQRCLERLAVHGLDDRAPGETSR